MIGTYQLSAKPYRTTEGEFKGQLEGVMFIATSSTKTQQWFAINWGQFVKSFCALVPFEAATEIVAALIRGDDVDFPSRLHQEQFDRGFHYEGSPVHFILHASITLTPKKLGVTLQPQSGRPQRVRGILTRGVHRRSRRSLSDKPENIGRSQLAVRFRKRQPQLFALASDSA
jgi:hypothetical protein